MLQNALRNFGVVVLFLLVISIIAFRPFIDGQNSPYTTEIAAAGLGTVLASIVTFVLLQSQARHEEAKEKSVTIYEKKFDAYKDLMGALEAAMSEGKPKADARDKLRFQALQTRFIAHESVVLKLKEFSEVYNDSVKDNEFSQEDWDQCEESVTELVNAMRLDLEADRKGVPLPTPRQTPPTNASSSTSGRPTPISTSTGQMAETLEGSDFSPKTSKAEFLSQCEASEKPYFEEVLSYCESHLQLVVIDWGGKGFSIKDRNRRQILWMFPQAGANSKSNINARTQKLTEDEKSRIEGIIRASGIVKGWSWRPADMPVSEVKKIINLVCGIS